MLYECWLCFEEKPRHLCSINYIKNVLGISLLFLLSWALTCILTLSTVHTSLPAQYPMQVLCILGFNTHWIFSAEYINYIPSSDITLALKQYVSLVRKQLYVASVLILFPKKE